MGSSLKIAAWLPLPWTRRRPLATRGIAHSTRTEILTHSTQTSHIRIRPTFHPGISHPKFFSADIPPWYLTSRILLRRHSTQIFHIRNSVQPTFHLLWIFRSRRLSPGERGGRFNFPGKTCPDPLVTLTQTAWLVKHSRFA